MESMLACSLRRIIRVGVYYIFRHDNFKTSSVSLSRPGADHESSIPFLSRKKLANVFVLQNSPHSSIRPVRVSFHTKV